MPQITLLSVMKYLKENKFEQSWLSLEQQSQVKLFTYSKQIQFFKKIILKGDFEEAIQFVNTLSMHIDQSNFKRACLAIYKQKLYELINIPSQRQLKKLFQKQLINCCSQDDFQNLFSLLACRNTQQIPGLSDWTVIKGRLHVFQQLLPLIESVLSGNKPTNQVNEALQSVPNLDQIVALYLQNKHQAKNQNFPGSIIRDINKNISSTGLNKQPYLASKQSSLVIKQSILPNKQPSMLSKIQGVLHKQTNTSKIKQSFNNNKQSNLYNMSSNTLKSDKKQVQVQLSQSQYQKSQISGIGFDKKSRSYMNNVSQSREVDPLQSQKRNQSQQYNNSQLHYVNRNESQYVNKSQIPNVNRNNSKIYVKQNNYFNPSKTEYSGSKLYREQQINQISQQQQRSDTVRSKPDQSKYVGSNVNIQSEEIQQSTRKNIQYLQQTNSVVYNNQLDRDQENFTFSHNNFTYDADKPRKILKLSTISDNKAIRTCQFSSSGSYFAVGTNSSILKIFQVNELFSDNQYKQIQPIYQINGLHSKSIFCLDWGKNQNSMVTCSNDLTIKLTQFGQYFQSHEISVIGRHQSCIRMVKFDEDRNKIFSCGDDSLIKVWDMGKVKRCYNLKGHSAGISAFKISQNNSELYSVSKDSTIKKWDLRTLQCVATSSTQQSQMTYISNGTQKIAASNKNGNVLFFDKQLNLEYEVKVHEEEIRSIEASPSLGLFLTASFDGHVGMFSQKMIHSPDYFQHNQNSQDKVVFATFLQHPQFKGFASTSTLGLCHIYSFN